MDGVQFIRPLGSESDTGRLQVLSNSQPIEPTGRFISSRARIVQDSFLTPCCVRLVYWWRRLSIDHRVTEGLRRGANGH